MTEINQNLLLTSENSDIQSIYAKYSAKLLGYIIEVIKDQKLSEEYLVKIFCELAKARTQNISLRFYTWNQVRVFAMHILSSNDKANGPDPGINPVDKLIRMNADQQFVFKSVYYYGKSLTVIATKLNQTEDTVRKTLKEAFAAMKENREN
ncbi:MAG TPA: hypothetical protein VKB19_20440 [Pedobacter sp.]|nr:hypothetical protein [Pedobacter sp.]